MERFAMVLQGRWKWLAMVVWGWLTAFSVPVCSENSLEALQETYGRGQWIQAFKIAEYLRAHPLGPAQQQGVHFYHGLLLKGWNILIPAKKSLLLAFQGDQPFYREGARLELLKISLTRGDDTLFFSLFEDLETAVSNPDHMSQLCSLIEESFQVFSWGNLFESYRDLLAALCQRGVPFESLLPFLRAYHSVLTAHPSPLEEYRFYSLIEQYYGYQFIPHDLRDRFESLRLNALFQNANQALDAGDFTVARDLFEQILKLSPFSPHHEDSLFLLGYLHYFFLGDQERAKWYLMQLTNPISFARRPQAALYLALILQEERKYPAALAYLEKIKKSTGRFTPDELNIFHFTYINALMLNGKKANALAHFQKLATDGYFRASPFFTLCRNSLRR